MLQRVRRALRETNRTLLGMYAVVVVLFFVAGWTAVDLYLTWPDGSDFSFTTTTRVHLDGEVFLGVIDRETNTLYRINIDNYRGVMTAVFGSWIHLQGMRYGNLIIPESIRPLPRQGVPFEALTPLPPPAPPPFHDVPNNNQQSPGSNSLR